MMRSSVLRRTFAALAIVLVAVAFGARSADAHADLISTDPPDGSVLTTAPAQVTLTFSENLDLALAKVELRTATGGLIPVSPVAFGANHHSIVAQLPELDRDAYRLSYDVRDPIDLHESVGSLVFGIGTAPVSDGTSASADPSATQSVLGWLARGGLALVVGGLFMALVAARSLSTSESRQFVVRRSLVVTRVGLLLVLAAELGATLNQVIDVGSPYPSTIRRIVLNSSFGHRFVITTQLCIGMLVFLRIVAPLLIRRIDRHLGLFDCIAGLLASGMVVVAAFSAHAGVGGAFAFGVLARIVHLGAMGMWVGGLVVLAVVRKRLSTSAWLAVVRSFSPAASVAVAVTIASGLFLSGREIASLTALFSTPFGTIVVVKVLTLAVALILGVTHARRVRQGGIRRVTLVAEGACALLVVLGGAFLATTPPAVGVRFSPPDPAVETKSTTKVDDLAVRLTLGPSRPGRNLMRVELIDSRKPAPAAARSVTVTITDASGVSISRTAGPPVDGVVDLDAVDIPSPGPLVVEVTVDRPSRPLPATIFRWTIGSTPTKRASTVISDRRLAPYTSTAAVALLLLAAILVARWRLSRWRSGRRRSGRRRQQLAVNAPVDVPPARELVDR